MWRKALFFSVLLFFASGWIVFDVLFSPLQEEAITVAVPALCGKRLEEVSCPAHMSLAVEYRHDEQAAAGIILAQAPKGGSVRKLSPNGDDIELRLTVSLGRESASVPSVVGKPRREAEAALRALGFTVKTVELAGSDLPGTVLSSDPRAGSELPRGAEIVLTVGAETVRESVRVPSVIGLTRSEALVRLWTAKLAVGEVTEQASPGEETDTVLRQSHQPETPVPAGTKIDLVIAAAQEE